MCGCGCNGAADDSGRRFDWLRSGSLSRRAALRWAAGGVGATFGLGKARHALVQPAPSGRCKVKNIKVWMNAFIPGSLPEYTVPVPGQSGKMMVPGPPGWDYFYTDHRSFDPNPAAEARMHSFVDIDVPSDTVTQRHWCDPTTRVDGDDGTVLCHRAGKNSGHFDRLGIMSTDVERRWRFILRAAAGNPCVPVAPDIDYEGNLLVKLTEYGTRVTVEFDGLIDGFPAFEMYVQVDGGTPEPILQEMPPPGNTPFDLFGWPVRKIRGGAEIITGTCGYRINDRTRMDSTRHGLGYDVTFQAFLAPDKANPDEWKVSGNWGGQALWVLVNPGQCSITRMEQLGGSVESGSVNEDAGYIGYALVSQPVLRDFFDERYTFGLVSDEDLGTVEERSVPFTAGELLLPMDADAMSATFSLDHGVIMDGGDCWGLVSEKKWVSIDRVYVSPNAPPNLPPDPPADPAGDPAPIPGPVLS